MKRYLAAYAVGAALTAAAYGFGAATAHASDYTGGNAEQVSGQLQEMGYTVQFKGVTNGDPSGCAVTGVEGLAAGKATGTAYIDLSCPSSDGWRR
jgi:hypothetical protein